MKAGWWRNRKFWLLLLGGILLALLARNLPLGEWLTTLKSWLGSLGVWAAPAFIFSYLLATIFGLPNIIFVLVAGTLFGLWKGILYASIADTLGAIACYGIGRSIARKRIKKWLSRSPNFAQLDQAVNEKGWKILLLARLSPLVPSNVLNYGFSCTKVNFWQYCFCSWLGMLPVISLYVYLGVFGRSLFSHELSPGKIAIQVVGLILAIAAAFYTTRLVKQYMSPQCPPEKAGNNPSEKACTSKK